MGFKRSRVQIPAARLFENSEERSPRRQVPGSNPGSPIFRNSDKNHEPALGHRRALARHGPAHSPAAAGEPDCLDKARSVLAKWMTWCDASVRPAFEEWRAILDVPISGVFAVLEGVDERSMRLRQSSPFGGILTPAERTAILMSHWRKQRTSRLMPLPLEHLTENTEHAA